MIEADQLYILFVVPFAVLFFVIFVLYLLEWVHLFLDMKRRKKSDDSCS